MSLNNNLNSSTLKEKNNAFISKRRKYRGKGKEGVSGAIDEGCPLGQVEAQQLVKATIQNAANWDGKSQAVWESWRREQSWGGGWLRENSLFKSHESLGDECTVIRLISSLIYRSRGYQRLHIRGRPED